MARKAMAAKKAEVKKAVKSKPVFKTISVAKKPAPPPKPAAPARRLTEAGEDATSTFYRHCRKWTLPKLLPLVETGDGMQLVRKAINSKKEGPLFGTELLEYLKRLELEVPPWKVRQQNAVHRPRKVQEEEAQEEEETTEAEEEEEEAVAVEKPKRRGRKKLETLSPAQATAALEAIKQTSFEPRKAKPTKLVFKLVKKAS